MNVSANTPLIKTVRASCVVEYAFDVFTSGIDLWWPQGHRRFRNSRVSLEAVAGGGFRETGAAGEEALLGEVVRCEPPHLIAYTWYPGAMTGPTLVEVRFTAEGAGTLVEIAHSEGTSGAGEAWTERVGRFDRAWSEVLPAFADFIEASTAYEGGAATNT